MPTGYTDKIKEGTTFKDFALICSRAFLYHLRDEPINSTVTKVIPSDYYEESLKESKADIKAFNLKTDEEIQIELEETYQTKRKRYHDSIDKIKKLRILYMDMYEEVLKYKSPSPDHNDFKTFMMKQLASTMTHDCSMDFITPPIRQGLENYKETMLDIYYDNITYYKKNLKEENDRCAKTNLWIDKLTESLE